MSVPTYNFSLIKNVDNRMSFILQEPTWVYKEITALSATSPLTITCPFHGIVDEWPVYIEGVSGVNAAYVNRDKIGMSFYMASRIDGDTLEINSSSGRSGLTGGYVVYRQPLNLTDALVEMSIYPTGSTTPIVYTQADSHIEAQDGVLTFVVDDAETIGYTRATYYIDITINGDKTRWLQGTIRVT